MQRRHFDFEIFEHHLATTLIFKTIISNTFSNEVAKTIFPLFFFFYFFHVAHLFENASTGRSDGQQSPCWWKLIQYNHLWKVNAR